VNAPDFRPPPPSAVSVQADALRAAFPQYIVNIIQHRGEPARYELVSRDGRSPCCLISTDAGEIWRELHNR
jgi:hypothetical protein